MRTLLSNRIFPDGGIARHALRPVDAVEFLTEKYKSVRDAGWLDKPTLDAIIRTGWLLQSFTANSGKVAVFGYKFGWITVEEEWAYEYDHIPSRVEIEQDLDVLYHYEKEDNK